MNQVVGAATQAQGYVCYVYDGPSAKSEPLDPQKFPEANASGARTVAQWFAQNPGAEGLSQFNGLAIWIKVDNWQPALGGLLPSAMGSGNKPSSYGLGVLTHELLHKQMVGGGFSHGDVDRALSAVGVKPGDYELGRERRSDQIGRLCF